MIRAGDRDDEWIVRVEWSEVFHDCNGPVSQYLLCMTSLTSDGKSESEDCEREIMTDETHYDLTLIANMVYKLTVRGSVCGNITGPESDPEMIIIYSKACICFLMLFTLTV